jgi:hypothetical protein
VAQGQREEGRGGVEQDDAGAGVDEGIDGDREGAGGAVRDEYLVGGADGQGALGQQHAGDGGTQLRQAARWRPAAAVGRQLGATRRHQVEARRPQRQVDDVRAVGLQERRRVAQPGVGRGQDAVAVVAQEGSAAVGQALDGRQVAGDAALDEQPDEEERERHGKGLGGRGGWKTGRCGVTAAGRGPIVRREGIV